MIPAPEECPSLAGERQRESRYTTDAMWRRYPEPNEYGGNAAKSKDPQPLAATAESRWVPMAAFEWKGMGKEVSAGPTHSRPQTLMGWRHPHWNSWRRWIRKVWCGKQPSVSPGEGPSGRGEPVGFKGSRSRREFRSR